MVVIDAEGEVLGRLCSYAAKRALMGEPVIVVNAEKLLISGGKKAIFKEQLQKLRIKNKGNLTKGPFHHKRPDRYVRRVIRGMLPYHKPRGREAFKRVFVYIGFPRQIIKSQTNIDISKEKFHRITGAEKSLRRGVTVEELCRYTGGSW